MPIATTLGKKVRVNSWMEVTAWKRATKRPDDQAHDQDRTGQLGDEHQRLGRQMENGGVVHGLHVVERGQEGVDDQRPPVDEDEQQDLERAGR